MMIRRGFGSAGNADRAAKNLEHGRSSPEDPARGLALCSNGALPSDHQDH
jgi:hypothetical protein